MKSYRLPLRLRDEGPPFTDILDADGVLVATIYPQSRFPAAEAFTKQIIESINAAPATDILAAARKVVAARWSGEGWQKIDDAIGELEDVIAGGWG